MNTPVRVGLRIRSARWLVVELIKAGQFVIVYQELTHEDAPEVQLWPPIED